MMRRSLCSSLVVMLLAAGCAAKTGSPPLHSPGSGATVSAADPGSAQFIHEYYQRRPAAGSALGLHEFDGQYRLPTRADIRSECERLHTLQLQLAAELRLLQPGSRRHGEVRLLQTVVDGDLLQLEGERTAERSPMFYLTSLDVSLYLKRDWKPLVERVRDLTSILSQSPAVFSVARNQLEPILPKPWVETAIEIADATASFLDHEVLTAGRECGNTEVAEKFAVVVKTAAREHRDFATWLRTHRLPAATPEFAIGRDLYQRLLGTELIDLPPEKILEIGMRELKAETARFEAAARDVDPTRPAAEVFKRIQNDHPTADHLISDTRRNLEAIRQFVVDHRILTLPSEVRAQVTETLPPFRATSFASMDTPGPFEKKATQAYYYVTPVEPNWPPAQQEEWLTAFNYYTTDVVSIHEAYPGHYVQFLALNASDASPVQKAFYSYAFAEGWAHYSEQMLLAEGFGQPADPAHASARERVRGASYRLAQSDEALLRVCRLCASVQMHCFGMSLDDATRFFVDNCHYEAKPARQEAIRGTFDPGYCFYTLGKLQFLKLREDWKHQEGAAYSLQRFHDQVLSHGGPPLRLLRETMLKDPTQHSTLF